MRKCLSRGGEAVERVVEIWWRSGGVIENSGQVLSRVYPRYVTKRVYSDGCVRPLRCCIYCARKHSDNSAAVCRVVPAFLNELVFFSFAASI